MRRTEGLLDRLGVSMLLSAALLCVAGPAWAEGTPPIIRFFGAWAEMRPTFLEPHLFLDLQVDDPDGQVPTTIQSVIVTGPDERTYDLTSRFSHPNLTFRGEYFFDAGSPVQTGSYTVAVTDTQGNTTTVTDRLTVFNAIAPASVVYPSGEEPIDTTAPTLLWEPALGAAGIRVRICNADEFNTAGGDCLYTSPVLAGVATQFTLPAGVVDPGRRYALRLEAYDDIGASLPAASFRASTFQPFSVAGPNVGLFLNQSTYRPGQTLHLGLNVRNNGAPRLVDVTLWVGRPDGAAVKIPLGNMEIASTSPDVTKVMNDYLVYTFTGDEPTGMYLVGIRLTSPDTGQIIAQGMGTLTLAP
jgi:hypothetical protein